MCVQATEFGIMVHQYKMNMPMQVTILQCIFFNLKQEQKLLDNKILWVSNVRASAEIP